jgi:hypothetical protein
VFSPAGIRFSLLPKSITLANLMEFEGHSKQASFALSAMQLYVGFFYLQSAMSKLLFGGGIYWFTSARTLAVYIKLIGPPSAQWLFTYPQLLRFGCTLVGIFDLLFLPLSLTFGRLQKILALHAFLFHVLVFMILNISFWHLWILFPALYFIANPKPVGLYDDSPRDSVPGRDVTNESWRPSRRRDAEDAEAAATTV